MYVPAWDRWRLCCGSCGWRGAPTWDLPAGPCNECGANADAQREEAILDLAVRSARAPMTYFDVTVRHSVPGNADRLAAAAAATGAVAREAEGDKKRRYPEARCPHRMVPLAVETYGCWGRAAAKHLRDLAKDRAEALAEDAAEAASALVLRWACRVGAALVRANATRVRYAVGTARCGKSLACELAD